MPQLNIKLDDAAAKHIEELRVQAGLKDNAALLRKALALFHTVHQAEKHGALFFFKHPDGKTERLTLL